MTIKDSNQDVCANCQQELPASDVIFCPHCGQKNIDGKVGMREFLERFFEHFTHLDNKFVRTVQDLFVPGKMTEVYFRGKRKRYPHPVQLFFIVMFFFLVAANHYSNRAIRISTSNQTQEQENDVPDNFFRVLQRQANSLRLHHLVDSLPEAYRDEHARQAIDSLLLLSHDPVLRDYQNKMLQPSNIGGKQLDSSSNLQELWRQWPELDTLSLKFGPQIYRVSLEDVAWLSEEELIDKYRVEGFANRLFFSRGIKVIHNPVGVTKSYFGSISWTILVLSGLMSALMFLLYRRQRRYFVEHFVFLMHWHSGILLFVALLLALGRVVEYSNLLVVIAILWTALSLFWAMHRYYQGNWKETAWRWALFISVYALAFALVFIGALVLVLLLF